MSITRRPDLPWGAAQLLRRELVERGVEPWIVSATPTSLLNRLDRETPQLRLVLDVEDADPDTMPRLGNPFTRMERLEADCTPDEVASVLTFARGVLVEPSFPQWDGAA